MLFNKESKKQILSGFEASLIEIHNELTAGINQSFIDIGKI